MLGADPNYTPRGDGWVGDSPLVAASKLGHVKVVTSLLELGADVDGGHCLDCWSCPSSSPPARSSKVPCRLPRAATALAAATAAGHVQTVVVLLSAGADPNYPGLQSSYSGTRRGSRSGGDINTALCTPLEYATARFSESRAAGRGAGTTNGEAILKVLRDAVKGWSIRTHSLHHACLQTAVRAVLLVNERLIATAGQHEEMVGADGGDSGDGGGDNLSNAPYLQPPPLPPELWHFILSFVKRGDWPVATHRGRTSSKGGGGATTNPAETKANAKVNDEAEDDARVGCQSELALQLVRVDLPTKLKFKNEVML